MKNSAKEAMIYLYNEIGENGITDSDFIQEFNNACKDADIINIRINSPGGSVFMGYAIFNTIANSKKFVNTYIDGIAASISTIIAMAGKKVYMSDNAMMMIHNPKSAMEGESKDMLGQAQLLDNIKKQMTNIYTTKTGLTADTITQMMNNTTWLTAQEAKQQKFIDEIIQSVLTMTGTDEVTPTNKTDPKLIFNHYNNNPKNLIGMYDKQLLSLLQLTDSATGIDVTKKIAYIIKENTSLKKKFEEQEDVKIMELVQNSINLGKITFGQKDSYLKLAKLDYDTTKRTLESIPAYKSLRSQISETGKPNNKGSKKDKSEWDLTDYRKYDPKALKDNPELYESLLLLDKENK